MTRGVAFGIFEPHTEQQNKKMRTKTVFLTAALVAAGALSSMAQSNVYSLNVVGYINLSLTNGYQMIANQLDLDGTGTNNTLSSVFSTNLPNLTTLLAWNASAQTFVAATYRASSGQFAGDPTDVTTFGIQPGEGLFVNLSGSAAPTTVTLVGTVLQAGSGIAYALPSGYSIASSQAPLSGGVQTTLGYPAGNLDAVLTWSIATGTYNASTYRSSSGAWTGGEPQITVGESFFVNVHSATGVTWTNTFVVN